MIRRSLYFLLVFSLFPPLSQASAAVSSDGSSTGLLEQPLPPALSSDDFSLPIFDGSEQADMPLQAILDAYHAGRYHEAVDSAKRLQEERGGGPEMLQFLLGDLYAALAQTEGEPALRSAIAAFRKAAIANPGSENAVRAYWRMGQIYGQLKLYTESIGSFTRVMKRHPESVFVLPARLGIARTYRAARQWENASVAYETVRRLPLSLTDLDAVLFEQADVMYHMDNFNRAYDNYILGEKGRPGYWGQDPMALFQFSESAYRTGRYGQARELYMAFHNVYVHKLGDVEARALALSRIGDTWRAEGRAEAAEKAYVLASWANKGVPGAKGSKLLALNGLLAAKYCPKDAKRCQPENIQLVWRNAPTVKDTVERLETLRNMGKIGRILLKEASLSPVVQDAIFGASKVLQRYGVYEEALELANGLARRFSQEARPFSSSFRNEVVAYIHRATEEAVSKWTEQKDYGKPIWLYASYPASFTPTMLTESVGMSVAESYYQTGLFRQALDIYEPIAVSVGNLFSEKALSRTGEVLVRLEDYAEAESRMDEFLVRYPTSSLAPVVLSNLAKMYHSQGEIKKAIEGYGKWIELYPENPDMKRMSLLLAKAYQQSEQYGEEVAVYLRLIDQFKEEAPAFRFLAADAYYNSSDFKKAIEYYTQALEGGGGGREIGRLKFQLANSYQALAQIEEGRAILATLAQNADDPLMRRVAAEKAHIAK